MRAGDSGGRRVTGTGHLPTDDPPPGPSTGARPRCDDQRVITVEERGAVSVVRIENGPVNVLGLDTLRELAATLDGLTEAPAVVLTGAGRAFSAGVDLKRLLEGGESYTREFLLALGGVFRTVFDHPRPLVAAVNGHAIAGGCVIAAGCDYRFMSAGTIGVDRAAGRRAVPGHRAGGDPVRRRAPHRRAGAHREDTAAGRGARGRAGRRGGESPTRCWTRRSRGPRRSPRSPRSASR